MAVNFHALLKRHLLAPESLGHSADCQSGRVCGSPRLTRLSPPVPNDERCQCLRHNIKLLLSWSRGGSYSCFYSRRQARETPDNRFRPSLQYGWRHPADVLMAPRSDDRGPACQWLWHWARIYHVAGLFVRVREISRPWYADGNWCVLQRRMLLYRKL